MRAASPTNGSINAFTFRHKSAVPRASGTVKNIRVHICVHSLVTRARVRVCVCMCALARCRKERERTTRSARLLYGKSPLWVIRLLVAKHRYIAFGVAQRASLPPSLPLPPPCCVLPIYIHTYICIYAHICVYTVDYIYIYIESIFISIFCERVYECE